MYKTNLPEADETRKAIERLLVRLTWIEELCEIALVIIVSAVMWAFLPHIFVAMAMIFYASTRAGNALLGNDRWSQLRKDRR